MSKLTNLADFLLGIANKLRYYLPSEGKINPQSFESKIDEIYKSGVGKLQTKAIVPGTAPQTVLPDAGYRGMERVDCSAVTPDIDPNIKPSNIKKGVTILGVAGTLEAGQGGGSSGSGGSGADGGEVLYLFPFKTEFSYI